MNIFKGNEAISKYGQGAKNGAIEIILDDDKYPDALKSIKSNSKKK